MRRHILLEHPYVGDLLACIGFFTRLPVPTAGEARSFAGALWAAPVAGLVVGLAVGLAMLVAGGLGLPAAIAAAIGLAAGMLVTGALHEDGAADVADGFGGGKTPEDRLAIMRDSRVGTYGALTLALSVLARWAALAAIASETGGSALLWAAVAAHAASRALLPAFAGFVSPARADGLSAGLGLVPPGVAFAALGLGIVALLPFGLGLTLQSILLLGAIFLALGWLCRRQIGGQTGDVLGAVQQAGEAAILFALAAHYH